MASLITLRKAILISAILGSLILNNSCHRSEGRTGSLRGIRPSHPNAFTIARVEKSPIIDGTLNDPTWQRATVFTDFKTLHPEAGKSPSGRTEVYLEYDRWKMYVGIRSLDQASSQIHADATVPEGISNDDWVAFCLDSHGDGISAFYFVVNAHGMRRAGILNFDGDPTATREMQWSSATSLQPNGYSVTMAIPFAELPFASGDPAIMSFKVARYISPKKEESDFPEIVPDRPHLAQLRRIELSGIEESHTPDEGFVADLINEYHAKVQRGKLFDYNTLEGRVQGWHGASVMDALVFPSRMLYPGASPFQFSKELRSQSIESLLERLEYLPGRPIGSLDRLLTRTQTQAFIVIQNDAIVYEKYFNGYHRDSMMTSFSVAKSFVSTLVGIAIDKGLIHSGQDPITMYLPELAQRDIRFGQITIKDLLHMSSGLRYVEDESPYDNDITYLDPDLRRAAFEKTNIIEPPNIHWLYNNYNPLLIGIILERVSGKSVTNLLQTELWGPLGMEYAGSWSIDSEERGFEKMESGINARAIDFAKLGALFLHQGFWRGRQIVSAAWVNQSTQPQPESAGFYRDENFFGAGGHYYGYFWWGSRRAEGKSDFYGVGNKGEFIYCSPQKNLLIVRTGMQYGIPSETWVRLFHQFADRLGRSPKR